MSEQERGDARDGFTTQLGALVTMHGAKNISAFLPTPTEPDINGFLEWARAREIALLFPSSREDGLLDWVRQTDSGYRTGMFGIDEPLGNILASDAVECVDLMIVPAAAADLSGNRLGWGRGYFDRTIETLVHRPPIFAALFDHEVLDSIPFEPHDARVQGIVTPKRILTFEK